MRAAGKTITAGEMRAALASLADSDPVYLEMGQDMEPITAMDVIGDLGTIELDSDPRELYAEAHDLLIDLDESRETKKVILARISQYMARYS